MSRRAASKAETRELILAAARELFWETGADGCTMRKIGERAGVAPASVVVHFQNKVSLLEAVLGAAIEERLTEAEATIPEGADLRSRLLHIASAFLHLYGANKDLYRTLIRNTCFEPDESSPRLADLNSRFLASVAGEVMLAQERGSVRRSVDPQMAAAAMFSLYLATLIHFLRTPDLEPGAALDLLAQLANDYLNGILVRSVNR